MRQTSCPGTLVLVLYCFLIFYATAEEPLESEGIRAEMLDHREGAGSEENGPLSPELEAAAANQDFRGADSPENDCPMWNYDAQRTGYAPGAELSDELQLHWVRELPEPERAWPAQEDDYDKLEFDVSYTPVVMGERIFVPCMVTDSLAAYDVRNGNEKWRFLAGGPVRLAPAAWNGRVYFVSDDGRLYCLDAETGELEWIFRRAPSDRTLLGNERLINMWPARGAPVIRDGNVYFAAGLWPFMGIFIYALEAETGEILWSNSALGTEYQAQFGDSHYSFAGLAPQGYLAASEDKLIVAGGRGAPAVLDRKTGEKIHYVTATKRYAEGTYAGRGAGGYRVKTDGEVYFNHGEKYDLQTGSFIQSIFADIITDDTVIGTSRHDYRQSGKAAPFPSGKVEEERVEGYVVGARMLQNRRARTDRHGQEKDSPDYSYQTQWSMHIPALNKLHVKAGSRVYGSSKEGKIISFQPGLDDSVNQFQLPCKTAVFSLFVAGGRLFAVTEAGMLYCLGPGEKETVHHSLEPGELPIDTEENAWAERVGKLVEETGVYDGHALILGLGSGRLLQELLAQTEMQIVVLDEDQNHILKWRNRLMEAGISSSRVAFHKGFLPEFELPMYLFELIVMDETETDGSVAEEELLSSVFHSLRPYGGTAFFPGEIEAVSGLDNAVFQHEEDFTLLRREGALPGAGQWTHQYGDVANTSFSSDLLAKAPLGVLWFGGPSNERTLPRHGMGPPPQVIGGRLFILGPHHLTARDVYSGRELWQIEIPGVGQDYTDLSLEEEYAEGRFIVLWRPGWLIGANFIGSNYVSTEDGIYILARKSLHRQMLEELIERGINEAAENFNPREPYSLSQDKKIPLIREGRWDKAGLTHQEAIVYFAKHSHLQFKKEAGQGPGQNLSTIMEAAEDTALWQAFEPECIKLDPATGEIESRLTLPPREKMGIENQLAGERRWGYIGIEGDKLLIGAEPQIFEEGEIGAQSYDATSSAYLVVMNRHSGEILWSHEAENGIRHNAIAAGNGKVFIIDSLTEAADAMARRRGLDPQKEPALMAFDLNSGDLLWREDQADIFGTFLGYSTEHDVLIQGGYAKVAWEQVLDDEPADRIQAHSGRDGRKLWAGSSNGPYAILDDMIISRAGEPFINLLSGEQAQRPHPLSGEMINRTFSRGKSCGFPTVSEHLLTVRSGAAAYYDLANDGGLGTFGGFRSGCTNNLILADGVLNAPDYTRTCACSYQLQTSLALVHMPEMEMWTTYLGTLPNPSEAIKQIGVNFGAPGKRRADNGVLWHPYPPVVGSTAAVSVSKNDNHAIHLQHSSAIETNSDSYDWVGASGAEGIESVEIKRLSPADSYRLRLHFSEPRAHAAPEERIFDVVVNERTAVENLDVFSATGGANRIKVVDLTISSDKRGTVSIDFIAAEESKYEPIISGVEMVKESSNGRSSAPPGNCCSGQ